MIKVYTTAIEAFDPEMKQLLFTGKTFDEACCEIEIKTIISKDSVGELSEAIIKAVNMLCEE